MQGLGSVSVAAAEAAHKAASEAAATAWSAAGASSPDVQACLHPLHSAVIASSLRSPCVWFRVPLRTAVVPDVGCVL